MFSFDFSLKLIWKYFITFYMLKFIHKNNKNAINIAQILTAFTANYYFIFSNMYIIDTTDIMSFYIYDTIIYAYKKDPLYVFHHLITFYYMSYQPSDSNYNFIMKMLYVIKVCDILIPYVHLMKYLKIDHTHKTLYDNFIKIISIYTLSAWLIGKIIMGNYLWYHLDNSRLLIPNVLLNTFNIYWYYKMVLGAYKKLIKLNDIKIE